MLTTDACRLWEQGGLFSCLFCTPNFSILKMHNHGNESIIQNTVSLRHCPRVIPRDTMVEQKLMSLKNWRSLLQDALVGLTWGVVRREGMSMPGLPQRGGINEEKRAQGPACTAVALALPQGALRLRGTRAQRERTPNCECPPAAARSKGLCPSWKIFPPSKIFGFTPWVLLGGIQLQWHALLLNALLFPFLKLLAKTWWQNA